MEYKIGDSVAVDGIGEIVGMRKSETRTGIMLYTIQLNHFDRIEVPANFIYPLPTEKDFVDKNK